MVNRLARGLSLRRIRPCRVVVRLTAEGRAHTARTFRRTGDGPAEVHPEFERVLQPQRGCAEGVLLLC